MLLLWLNNYTKSKTKLKNTITTYNLIINNNYKKEKSNFVFNFYLFHHPIWNVAKALFTFWAGFESLCFTGAAHNVSLTTLYDWWRNPVFANRTRKKTNQRVIIDKASCCSKLRYSILFRRFGKASCWFAQASLTCKCYRTRLVVSAVLHCILFLFFSLQSQLAQYIFLV